MNDVLPADERAVPVSGVAVLGGVLAAYGAYAVLISIVAAFANGAHSHQVLSGATWKQLGTGGGITAGVVLFLAWGAGGFFAARMARGEGVRHGVWVFIVGVVLMTVVGAAITWLPDTTAILRNLRLLGLPVRRNEWRDVGTVAGIASLVGMAVGAIAGGWFALRERAAVPAPAAAPAPAAEPAPVAAPLSTPAPPEPAAREEEVAEPAFAGPSLFEAANVEPESEQKPDQERVAQDIPAWQQFLERSDRLSEGRDEPEPAVESAEPAPWIAAEPAPAFISEPETPSTFDDAWRLPDDEPPTTGVEGPESAAFPHPAPAPVPEPSPSFEPERSFEPEQSFEPEPSFEPEQSFEPEPQAVVVPPLDEHADWDDDNDLYRAPPEATDDDVLQHAPEAPPPEPEIDPEEREARRRQQEEAARAYEQAREDP